MTMGAENGSKVLLLFPPLWLNEEFEVDFPPLGLPALVGALRAHGVPVEHRDLNADFYTYLLDRVQTEQLQEGLFQSVDKFEGLLLRNLVDDWLNRWNDNFRPDFIPRIRNLSFEDFTEVRCDMIASFMRDRRNPFLAFFLDSRDLQSDVASHAEGIIGISILGPSQVLASLTLASLINEWVPGARVVLGGPWTSLFAEQLKQLPDLACLYDALVVGEGETSICHFSHLLEHPERWGEAPNLHFRIDGSPWRWSRPFQENLNDLPAPDFTDLNPDNYAFPGTFTYQTSRGCYWNRCVFCEHTHGGSSAFKCG